MIRGYVDSRPDALLRSSGHLQRQNGGKGTALSMSTAHCHSAALRLREPLGQRQTEAGPLMFFGSARVELLKLSEQSADLVGGNADTGVDDVDTKPVTSVR